MVFFHLVAFQVEKEEKKKVLDMCWFAQAAIEPVACSLTSSFGSFCLYHCSLQYQKWFWSHSTGICPYLVFLDLFFYSFLSKSRANSSPISPLCQKNIQLNRADNAAGVPLPQKLQIKNPNQIIIIKKIRCLATLWQIQIALHCISCCCFSLPLVCGYQTFSVKKQ